MKTINKLLICAASVVSLGWSTSCGRTPATTNIQILCTSDIHGMLIPFDYALNKDVTSRGSLSQIGSIINLFRNDNTLTIDVGDILQGNYADLFKKYDTHPMIEGLNMLDYDVFVTGNHEYNFGMDYLKSQISKFKGTTLTGNVYDKNMTPLTAPYAIFNKGGVKVAVIGMTTQLIKTWDAKHLEGWTVTNAIEETKKAVNEIKTKKLADVIIAAEHLGMPKEYGQEGTSCRDLANECPDIDVILGAHEHSEYIETVNDVLVVENKNNAQTLMKIDLQVNRKFNECYVEKKKATKIEVGKFPRLKKIENFAKPYDEEAKKDAGTVIGKLENGPMAPEFEIKKVPSTFMKPTPLTTFINQVQLAIANKEVGDVKVAATAVGNYKANLDTGDIHKYDCSNIYKYENTLYVLNMNGKQLKQYMEWSVDYYNQYKDKDLTISFADSKRMSLFNYDMFTGVDYEIDVSQPKGSRIKNLKWSDGTKEEVKENDEFKMAINNYRSNSQLLKPGPIYEKESDCPTLYKGDLQNGKGIREMIVDYVTSEKTIDAKSTDLTIENWKIVGNNWDEDKHKLAVDKINSGGFDIGEFNNRTMTESDL